MRLKFVLRIGCACGLVPTAVQALRQEDVQPDQRFSDVDVTMSCGLCIHISSSSSSLESLGFLRPGFELLPSTSGWSQVAQRPIQLPHLHALYWRMVMVLKT